MIQGHKIPRSQTARKTGPGHFFKFGVKKKKKKLAGGGEMLGHPSKFFIGQEMGIALHW